MLFWTFLLTEVSHIPARQQLIYWQDALIKGMMSDFSYKHVRALSKDYHFKKEALWSVCDQKYFPCITCQKMQIQQFILRDFSYGNFHLNFLPPTVENVVLHKCGQSFRINTRRWPRELIVIDLSKNRIHGRPDLTALPEKLQHVILYKNRLSGPIELTALPKDLRMLYLQDNQFQQEILYYQFLPVNLQQVYLQQWNHGKRQFQEVRASTQKEERAKGVTFTGIDLVDGEINTKK